MIEIEEPPAIPGCTTCWNPFTWLWSPRKKTWLPFVTVGDRTIRLDTCDTYRTETIPSWRHLSGRFATPDVERQRQARDGAQRVRAVLQQKLHKGSDDVG